MNELNDEIVEWLVSEIGLLKYELLVKTVYSEVWKIKNSTDLFYLKRANGSLFSEPKMMQLVSKTVGAGICPEVVGVNQELKLFLTKSLGTITLREKFDRDGFDIKHVAKSYGLMQHVQTLMSKNIDECLEYGTTDWRRESMTKEFTAMLNGDDFGIIYHMNGEEIGLAMNGVNILKEAAVELESVVPGYVWSDDDFNDKNIVINGSGYGFLDLGETSISFPIVGLYASLKSLKWKYNILDGSKDDVYLRDACLDSYAVLPNQRDVVWSICEKIYPIYASLCLHRLVTNSSTELLLNERYKYRMKGHLSALNHK